MNANCPVPFCTEVDGTMIIRRVDGVRTPSSRQKTAPSSTMMASVAVGTRQRRGRSPTAYTGTTSNAGVDSDSERNNDDHDGSVEPMDEDEQRALIEKLRKEAADQTSFFQMMFGYGVGGFGIVLSLALPIICQEECQHTQIECWGHSFISLALHILAVYPFVMTNGNTISTITASKQQSGSDSRSSSLSSCPTTFQKIIGIILQLTPVAVWLLDGFGDDRDHFHFALLIGNAITFSGHHFIVWDIESTNKALADLEKAQYNHKSL